MSNTKRSSLQRYHLKQQLRELEAKKSANLSTSLVTLYIPPGTQLSDISSKLRDELGTATNIKDKTTGKAVSEALRSILSRMTYLEKIAPQNGLAIFAGITDDAQKNEYYAIEPPEPVTIKDYVCDVQFHVDHLKEMLAERDELGIIVIDRGGATFATVRGAHLNIIMHKDSFVPGKHNKGGQSAGRIERGIEILAQEFYSKMAHLANQLYLEEYPVAALVVGGPAMSKDDFLQHPTLDYRLKEKIYKVYDVGYTGISGIRELLTRAQDDLTEYGLIKERNLFQKFLYELSVDTGKAIYGEQPIRKAFENSAVEIMLFSEEIDKLHVKIACSNCDKRFLESTSSVNLPELETKINDTTCPGCGNQSLSIESKQPIIEEFEKMAIDSGATIEIISTGHEDGLTLLNTFTGLAAILRFPIEW
ncbi:MAG: peptide chain release factor aRF-1 [Candidatus Heimdallarchaeota archaeon]|nr:peptide chain release factor aRF-1 [Candidatus Heimdallarchaeota archaeon]